MKKTPLSLCVLFTLILFSCKKEVSESQEIDKTFSFKDMIVSPKNQTKALMIIHESLENQMFGARL